MLSAPATDEQISSARALVALALAEEPDEFEQTWLCELRDHLVAGLGLKLVRAVVQAMGACALPGGDLEVSTKAWLALRENGGTE